MLVLQVGGKKNTFAKNPAKMPWNLDCGSGNRQRQWKRLLRIGTWNVQGISTKRIEVFRELERLKIDIAALTETKRKGNGIEEERNYIQIYSGVNKDQRAKCGVSLLIKKKYKKCIKNVNISTSE